MGIWGWVKFAWALWGLRGDAKELWDKMHDAYEGNKAAPKPTVAEFKGTVKEALIGASPALVTADGKEIEGGLSGNGKAH